MIADLPKSNPQKPERAFDVETTDAVVGDRKTQMIEIGAVEILDSERLGKRFDMRVKPTDEAVMNPLAFNAHRIRLEDGLDSLDRGEKRRDSGKKEKKAREAVCAMCGESEKSAKSRELVRCCGDVWYCGADCQLGDFSKGHQRVCVRTKEIDEQKKDKKRHKGKKGATKEKKDSR